MRVDIDREDLLSLVRGTSPYYTLFDNELIKGLGSFTGGFVDRWDWSTASLEKLSEQSLWIVYEMCKKSWDA